MIKTYQELFPKALIGLSDHTTDELTVLSAVSLGAKVIEKHFTDDNSREGPDHSFAINPENWQIMVNRTRELEIALGDGKKVIEKNEFESSIVQKRGLYAKKEIKKGAIITINDFDALRPCQLDSVSPRSLEELKEPILNSNLNKGDNLKWENIKDLVFVIPCFNEEKTIGSLVNSIRNMGDVLIIDDCSSDNSFKEGTKNKALIYKNEINIGYHKSLLKGILLARRYGYKYCITLDADKQHPIEEIPKIYNLLKTNIKLVHTIREKLKDLVKYFYLL